MHERPDLLRQAPPAAIHASPAEGFGGAWLRLLRESPLQRPFAVALGAGVFLGLLGPFGMAGAPIGIRVAYWVAAIAGGTAVGLLTSSGVAALIDREGRRPWLVALATALVMTPPTAVLIAGVTELFFPHSSPFGSLPQMFGAVLLVSLGMSGVNALAHRPAEPQPVSPSPQTVLPQTALHQTAAPPVRFLERMPPKLRGAAIEAVESEDHYLRIHTARGSDLILMRLADAIAELEGLDGAQTHRSWWVARAAVRDVKRGDGRATLVLASGVEAPVSRSYLAALRERGWL